MILVFLRRIDCGEVVEMWRGPHKLTEQLNSSSFLCDISLRQAEMEKIMERIAW
jgi:hypothetical protein